VLDLKLTLILFVTDHIYQQVPEESWHQLKLVNHLQAIWFIKLPERVKLQHYSLFLVGLLFNNLFGAHLGLSQAATCYYQFNHSKVEAIPLSALPKDITSVLAGLFPH